MHTSEPADEASMHLRSPVSVNVLTFLELKSDQRLWWRAPKKEAAASRSVKLTKAYPRLHLFLKSMGK